MRTIISTTHELVKHWVRLRKERSYREETGRVLVEGKNCLKDLLVRHKPVRCIVTESQSSVFEGFGEERIIVSDAVAEKISDVQAPEGFFAEFDIPKLLPNDALDQVLILDRLQDPGNVGTLLRTSLALGLSTVIFIEPCCDPWNSKAIRSAKGAQFDLNLIFSSWKTLPKIPPLLVADAKGISIHAFQKPDRWALVLGSEAHGPSIPLTCAKTAVSIPMAGPMESLNVAQAGAILLYCLL